MLPFEQTLLEEIHHAVLLRTGRDRVFATLTTTSGWNAWFTEDMSLDPQPGGRIIFQWKNWGPDHISTSDYGTVAEVIDGARFSFHWHPDSPTYETLVSLDLFDDPEGTIVRVSEIGFADTPEGLHAFGQSAAGWGEALTLLKFYLERGLTVRD